MTEWLDALIAWVNANPTWAGVLVFLVAFSESLAIVGMIVPGVVMMFAAGALIGANVVDFWMIFWWAVAGAILGDGLSFFIGHYYRDRLRAVWPFRNYSELLDQGVLFFNRWGGKSVAIGRFFGPVRAVVPLVAGMLKMPTGRYLAANIISSFGWAIAYLLPGIAIGASLELASEVAFHLVVLLISLVILLWLILWVLHRLFLFVQPLAHQWLQGLLAFSRGDTLPRRIAAALADPTHPEAKGLSLMAAMIVLSVFFLALVSTALFGGTGFGIVDRLVHEYSGSLHAPMVDSVMVLVTTLGDGWFLSWLSFSVMVLLVIQHRPTAWHWLAAVGYAAAVPWLLKNGLQVARPPNAISDGWSFPSAHALYSSVIYGFLAVLLATRLQPEKRWLVYAVSIVLVALIGFSRLYLGVHWFSDVLAGWLLGFLWVAVLGLAWRHHQHPRLQLQPLIGGILLCVGLMLAWHLSTRHEERVAHYQQSEVMAQEVIAFEAWQQGAPLPLWRQTLTSREDITLRVAISPSMASHELAKHGWRTTKILGTSAFLRYLSTSVSEQELPPLPKVYAGNLPVLQMTKMINGKRQTLRLWKTAFQLGSCPVLVGHLLEEEVGSLLGLMRVIRSHASTQAAAQSEISRLLNGMSLRGECP